MCAALPGGNADRLPYPHRRDGPAGEHGRGKCARHSRPARSGAAATVRDRQIHGPRDGALPADASASGEQQDRRAGKRACQGPQPAPRTESEIARFREILAWSHMAVAEWRSECAMQKTKLAEPAAAIDRLDAHLPRAHLTGAHPWDRLWRWAEASLTLEGREILASTLLDPYPRRGDGLAGCMQHWPGPATTRWSRSFCWPFPCTATPCAGCRSPRAIPLPRSATT